LAHADETYASEAILADRAIAQRRHLLEELGRTRNGCVPGVGATVVGLSTADALGAVVSTVQVRLAGVESVLPWASVVLTTKVCCPLARLS
jgi:hypothetical protein